MGSTGQRQSTTVRFDPMNTSWPVIAVDVIAVLLVTLGAFELALALGDGWQRLVLFVLFGGAALTLFVALPLRYFLLAQRRDADRREEALRLEGQRREFNATLTRALEMAQDEGGVLGVAHRTLDQLTPGAHGEILLADSSQAHLLKVVNSPDPDDALPGCAVGTPHGCPAVRMGHPLVFADSDRLDVCPHLAGRASACGAVCVPVGVMGAMVGVVHVVHRVDHVFDDLATEGLESVAHQVGSRLGVLNAISQSQIQANTDPLTGLLNRRSFEQNVHALTRESATFALAFADLDHFKQLNDAHGHDMGDRALRLFARTMRRSLPNDALIARHGGEEFVVALPNCDVEHAIRSLDQLRADLEIALADGRVPPFTMSAGVVDNTESTATTLDELVEVADNLLLQAKGAGRNRVLGPKSAANVIDIRAQGA